MRIVDNDLLAEFRAAWRCEHCGRATPSGCDPAHIFARGRGNAFRMDVRENLVSLCRECHIRNHAGKSPTKDELLAIAGRRLNRAPQELGDYLRALRWGNVPATD